MLSVVCAALLARAQPAAPRGPSSSAAAQPGSAQPASLRVGDFTFVPAGYHEIPIGPLPWPGLVPLDGSPARWRTSCTPRFTGTHILDFQTKLILN